MHLKKSSIKIFIHSILIGSLIASCVPQKKYDELLARKIQLEADLADKEGKLEAANDQIDRLDEQVNKLVADTISLGEDIRSKKKKLGELDAEYKELETYYNNLLTNSGKLNRDLAEQQEKLLALKENLDETKKVNEALSNDLREREKKVQELETILANKDKAVQELKDKISNALLNFKENDLTIDIKNGKVYVSLAEQLLFKSGSIDVDEKGKGALQQLAKALKDQRDINIMVEGHTDNVPISRTSKFMNDNWDLSVLRATSIVKILTGAGLDTNQITAAGKGEFSPLTSNETTEGRAKNRRTEIIITPDLDELFQILEAN